MIKPTLILYIRPTGHISVSVFDQGFVALENNPHFSNLASYVSTQWKRTKVERLVRLQLDLPSHNQNMQNLEDLLAGPRAYSRLLRLAFAPYQNFSFSIKNHISLSNDTSRAYETRLCRVFLYIYPRIEPE